MDYCATNSKSHSRSYSKSYSRSYSIGNPISEWILKSSQLKEPVVETANKAGNLPAKINWLLLGCALQQGIHIYELQFFLTELQKNIDDIADLPAPSESLILNAIAKSKLKLWNLAPQVAGIVWSVGRFARARENRLDLWLKNSSPFDIWKACGDIFYMGKSNPLRPKVLGFLFRVNQLVQIKAGKMPPLPSSAGAKRWLIQTGTYNPEDSPKEKLSAVNSLYKELYPKNPALACHALQLFTEPANETIYFCQKLFACNSCPVSDYCRR